MRLKNVRISSPFRSWWESLHFILFVVLFSTQMEKVSLLECVHEGALGLIELEIILWIEKTIADNFRHFHLVKWDFATWLNMFFSAPLLAPWHDFPVAVAWKFEKIYLNIYRYIYFINIYEKHIHCSYGEACVLSKQKYLKKSIKQRSESINSILYVFMFPIRLQPDEILISMYRFYHRTTETDNIRKQQKHSSIRIYKLLVYHKLSFKRVFLNSVCCSMLKNWAVRVTKFKVRIIRNISEALSRTYQKQHSCYVLSTKLEVISQRDRNPLRFWYIKKKLVMNFLLNQAIQPVNV